MVRDLVGFYEYHANQICLDWLGSLTMYQYLSMALRIGYCIQ